MCWVEANYEAFSESALHCESAPEATEVRAALKDGDGVLVAADTGLLRRGAWAWGSPAVYTRIASAPSPSARAAFTQGDLVWLATAGGAARVDRATPFTTALVAADGMPFVDLHAAFAGPGGVWFGGSGGLVRYAF
jgi:hypothetical protein